jgi:hypothetical protein
LADGNSSKPLQSKQKAIDRRVAIRERSAARGAA